MQETEMPTQDYYDLLVKSAYDGTFPSIVREPTSGCQFAGSDIRCKYRVPGTSKKCAVGVLIPDEKYSSKFETKRCSDPMIIEAMTKVKGFNCSLYGTGLYSNDYLDVQIAHDTVACGCEWKPEWFIEKINTLKCFKDVVKVQV